MTAASSTKPTILITGSNRGIGLEFAKQYAGNGWRVVATCRNPEAADDLKALAAENTDVTVEALDVLDHDMVDALAATYAGVPLDVLLNNAGFFGTRDMLEQQMPGRINYDLFEHYIWLDAVSPLKVAEAFLDHVAASQQKKIISMSSLQGSIQGGLGPGQYFYRASKAALNILMVQLSKDVRDRGIVVGLLSPGLVLNDRIRNASIPGGVERAVSVAGMIEVIESLTPETSGSFLRWDGQTVPW